MTDPQQEPSRVVIVYETEEAARDRLVAHGFAPDIAAEIAVYLAQATDLAERTDELQAGLAAEGVSVDFVELDALPGRMEHLHARREGAILWCQTDGFRYYRGSAVSALARLIGVARYGSPPDAQHLCQDKFASLSLAGAAGLPILPSLLLEADQEIASLGKLDDQSMLFVKPATLGAKIGIFPDSRCRGLAAARSLSCRLWERYRDRALVQPFIEGDDVRVTFMNTGKDFSAQLGIARLLKDPRGEAGGAFMTMKDNETLSGARDTSGGRGGFGATRQAAFVPKMIDLKREAGPHAAQLVGAITSAAARLARLLRLDDYFSIDFRVDSTGRPIFLEFEVCPAVTIYDFQHYLETTHGLGLSAALARSLRIAFRRHRQATES
ncbi:MAG: hypothetical protein JO366_04050 [Methylobacteriaceae bacterium]|nr:hypothetical protein [Methylobacteriaceae bacterium]